MNTSTHIRSGRHCVFNMHVHLVFVTKYRKACFSKKHLNFMQKIFESVCVDFEAELIEFDGEKNHVHLLIHYPPKLSVSKLVNSLKGVSSRYLRKHFSDLTKCFWGNVLWSPSYFSGSCGGAPIDILRKYIENQKTPT
ncbi:MAG: IS200/IS605 family transposase [Simkaniaceae bacterium]|nr:IS200/IS605 family transposase [Simkaniaceae bacterium]